MPGGEVPESSFSDDGLHLFFYGVLYNRDRLETPPECSNAYMAAMLYRKEGSRGLARLDGSFTVIYYSPDECGVIRDHHGTHYSFYYTSDGYFATSWQQLEVLKGTSFCYDPVSLSAFLQRGILSRGGSVVSGVRSLEAGNRLCVKRNATALACEDLFRYEEDMPLYLPQEVDACACRYAELHLQAIRRRIRDKRRVGILLSGGYDSGSNLAALRSIYDGRIDSYSVGFKGDTWSELPVARMMSQAFGTCHHEYEIDGTEICALPEIIRFLGEPFVEGGLMVNYCAMRMIGGDRPDVVLGGDGNDQYFGTSAREVALHYLFARMGMLPLLRGVCNLLAFPVVDKGGKLSRLRFHADKTAHVLEGERFGFTDRALYGMLQHPGEDMLRQPSPRADLRSFNHLYTQHARVSDLEIVINRIILFKASRMARMFGQHLTFPFMDTELFHFLRQLPVEWKCKTGGIWDAVRGRSISKYLLKYHYKPLLPEEVTAKKKQGGFAPMPLFFRDHVQRARFKDFILSSGIMDDYLRRDAVEKFLCAYDREAEHASWFWYRQNRALQYFQLLALAVWWEEFVTRRQVKF